MFQPGLHPGYSHDALLLGEGREGNGLPTGCDWQLENAEPVTALPAPSPTEIAFASGKNNNEDEDDDPFHSTWVRVVSPWETVGISNSGPSSASPYRCQHSQRMQ